MKITTVRSTVLSVLVLSRLALMAGTAADHSPTYAEQVSRILQEHCVACHQPGGVGPFSLTNYPEARAFAREIRLATQSRKEPPWFALPGHGEFQNQRQLTVEQIKTLGAWFDAGSPMGNQKDLPPEHKQEHMWAYGPPDAILAVTEPYNVAASVGEDIRCFVMPTSFPGPKAIRAMDVRPGDPSVVYHVRAFADVTGLARRLDVQDRKSGFDCSLNMGSLFTQKLLGEWEAGMTFPPLTDGMGRYLPKGADVVLEIHYHQIYKTTSDRTKVALYFQPHVRQYVQTATIVNRKIRVPSGRADYRATAEWVTTRDIIAIGVSPHMHRLGTAMRIRASIPGGQMRDLVWVNRYDFRWQTSYMFKEPIPIAKGTIIRVEAFYDNSEQNLNLNPHHPWHESRWGNSLKDEMLAAFVEYVDLESPRNVAVEQ
jgi:mono/diheme cytochrome c family protein